jgi:hypothetical protein
MNAFLLFTPVNKTCGWSCSRNLFGALTHKFLNTGSYLLTFVYIGNKIIPENQSTSEADNCMECNNYRGISILNVG